MTLQLSILKKVALGAFFMFPLLANAQPANDDPCGAITLTVNNGLYAPNPDNYSANSATNTSSALVSLPTCSTPNADIWFKFVATSTQQRITRRNLTGTSNVGFAIYSSDAGSCSDLTQITCSTSGATVDVTSCVVGDTYYLRVWNASTTSSSYSMDLGIGAPAATPTNNECANAISIDDGLMHEAYTENATQSKAAYDCGFGLSSEALDVWYKFTAVADGTVNISAARGTLEPYINIERFNSCADATPVPFASGGCDDDEIDGISLSVSAVTGSTYYIRMYASDASSSSTKGYMTIEADGTPLPVNMGQLSAQLNNEGQVSLSWNTKSEHNNRGFFLERSTNGKNFENIAFVASAATQGNSSASVNYGFIDKQSIEGALFYRLKQTDIDGETAYSNIASVNATVANSEISLFPNPVTDVLSINFGNHEFSGSVIRVTDMAGRIVVQESAISGLQKVNLSALSSGTYLLSVQTTGQNKPAENKLIIKK